MHRTTFWAVGFKGNTGYCIYSPSAHGSRCTIFDSKENAEKFMKENPDYVKGDFVFEIEMSLPRMSVQEAEEKFGIKII